MHRRIFCWIICICFCADFLLLSSANAQASEKPEWGNVSADQFDLKIVTAFPEADAVVLHDYGELSFVQQRTGFPGAVIDRHVRIKIFSKAGLYLAQQVIPYVTSPLEDREQVKRIKAQTLLMENGQVRVVPVSKNAIQHVETGDGWKEVQINFPEVTEGAILEYRYRLIADNYINPPEWPFQREIPTLTSQFKANIWKDLDYSIILIGAEKEQVQLLAEYHWQMDNMPPIREEPFITTLNDNWHRLRFQLRGERSALGYTPYLYSWKSFSKKLLKDPELGGRLDSSYVELRETARELASLFTEDEQKIDVLYQAVRDRITWSQESDLFTPFGLDQAWKAKKGNSAAINLCLVYMLRAAGIRADPLLIGTRDHGAPIRSYPDLNSFNHLICYVDQGEDGLLLDATDPLRPYTLPASRDLNQVGWLLNRKSSRWVEIRVREFVAMQQVYGVFTFEEDGSLKGELTETTGGYTALTYRKNLAKWGANAFLKRYLQDYLTPGMVTSYSLKGGDIPESPFVLESNIVTAGFSRLEEDQLILQPLLMFAMRHNPLPNQSRYQPLNFGYPYQSMMWFSYQIPEGYEVAELPEKIRMSFPNQEVMFEYKCEMDGKIINVMSSFFINAPRFSADAYLPLRNIYAKLIEKHAAEIVFRKK